MKWFRNLYLPNRFFVTFSVVVILLCAGFAFKPLYWLGVIFGGISLAFVFADFLILFNPKNKVTAERHPPSIMSLGDPNVIRLDVYNNSPIKLSFKIIDELPVQLQERDFIMESDVSAKDEETVNYQIEPQERGEFIFNRIHLYAESFIGLVTRRFRVDAKQTVQVFPSVQQMKKYEFRAFSRSTREDGIKKLRKLGHSYEFEQIKNYVRGDDIRSINWKATGRRGELMVNQYEDEKSQSIYCVIDKSRVMKMPFNGLSLMDHAINSTLVLLNIALLKQDKAGLITFSDKIGATIRANRGKGQIKSIMNALYREEERTMDANFELLYYGINKVVPNRSLLLLYTNFESLYAVQRALPVLRRINKHHLLVVTFFINTEIETISNETSHNVEEIYHQTVAKKFMEEKRMMVRELRKYGIHSILTRPEDLAVNSVNKYLEMKARSMI